jgi:hypothetical protein
MTRAFLDVFSSELKADGGRYSSSVRLHVNVIPINERMGHDRLLAGEAAARHAPLSKQGHDGGRGAQSKAQPAPLDFLLAPVIYRATITFPRSPSRHAAY